MGKVLLASMSAGGGHHALRDSFHTALKLADPDANRFETVAWDSSDQLINWFYSLCVHHLPRFQGQIYALSGRPWASALLARLSPGLFLEALRVLRRERPDAVISTHPLLTMMLVKAKHTLKLSTPVVAAIPDYGTPTAAFNPPKATLKPDFLVVMAEDTLRHYLEVEQVSPGQVHLSGFLTRAPFDAVGRARQKTWGERGEQRAALLRTLALTCPELGTLQPELPTVLFAGGSAWTEKTLPVLEKLLATPTTARAINVVVVCGRDTKFRDLLRRRHPARPQFAVVGHVPPDKYARVMGLADLPVLGSLAPASMQELLETRCGPLLLFSFIPGTEAPHAAYIEAERIGLHEPDAGKMLELLEQAVELKPASARLKAVMSGFAQRAEALRAASVTRAHTLPDFVERVMDASTAHPRRAGRKSSVG